MKIQEPTIHFFRGRPEGWAINPYIASSMQSLESSFFLIALGRFPHALSVCASAIESCLHAAKINAKENDGFQVLVRKAKGSSNVVAKFDEGLLCQFREKRNRIIHHGFSIQDDSESASLYLEVGLPFISVCYQEFHQFDLMEGLLIEFAQQIKTAQTVLELVKKTPNKDDPNLDMSYCLNSFGHLIRWGFKHSFSANWEIDSLIHSEETGQKFEKMHKEQQRLEQLFRSPYTFDCPICDELEVVIAELDSDALDVSEVRPICMACTSCGFVASTRQPYLAQVLLEQQVSKSRAEIHKEYGIE
jgi:transcription elongation factor Elf1